MTKFKTNKKKAKAFTIKGAAALIIAAILAAALLFTGCNQPSGSSSGGNSGGGNSGNSGNSGGGGNGGGGGTPPTPPPVQTYKVELDYTIGGNVTVTPALPEDGMIVKNTELTFTATPLSVAV